jgi:hypothetical protein
MPLWDAEGRERIVGFYRNGLVFMNNQQGYGDEKTSLVR